MILITKKNNLINKIYINCRPGGFYHVWNKKIQM